jgi:hypothetical protein
MMGSLYYGRHFLGMACIVVFLAATGRWRPQGAAVSVGLYGALHSSMVIFALRSAPSFWRALGFIAIAASLAVLSIRLSLAASPAIVEPSWNGAPVPAPGVLRRSRCARLRVTDTTILDP